MLVDTRCFIYHMDPTFPLTSVALDEVESAWSIFSKDFRRGAVLANGRGTRIGAHVDEEVVHQAAMGMFSDAGIDEDRARLCIANYKQAMLYTLRYVVDHFVYRHFGPGKLFVRVASNVLDIRKVDKSVAAAGNDNSSSSGESASEDDDEEHDDINNNNNTSHGSKGAKMKNGVFAAPAAAANNEDNTVIEARLIATGITLYDPESETQVEMPGSIVATFVLTEDERLGKGNNNNNNSKDETWDGWIRNMSRQSSSTEEAGNKIETTTTGDDKQPQQQPPSAPLFSPTSLSQQKGWKRGSWNLKGEIGFSSDELWRFVIGAPALVRLASCPEVVTEPLPQQIVDSLVEHRMFLREDDDTFPAVVVAFPKNTAAKASFRAALKDGSVIIDGSRVAAESTSDAQVSSLVMDAFQDADFAYEEAVSSIRCFHPSMLKAASQVVLDHCISSARKRRETQNSLYQRPARRSSLSLSGGGRERSASSNIAAGGNGNQIDTDDNRGRASSAGSKTSDVSKNKATAAAAAAATNEDEDDDEKDDLSQVFIEKSTMDLRLIEGGVVARVVSRLKGPIKLLPLRNTTTNNNNNSSNNNHHHNSDQNSNGHQNSVASEGEANGEGAAAQEANFRSNRYPSLETDIVYLGDMILSYALLGTPKEDPNSDSEESILKAVVSKLSPPTSIGGFRLPLASFFAEEEGWGCWRLFHEMGFSSSATCIAVLGHCSSLPSIDSSQLADELDRSNSRFENFSHDMMQTLIDSNGFARSFEEEEEFPLVVVAARREEDADADFARDARARVVTIHGKPLLGIQTATNDKAVVFAGIAALRHFGATPNQAQQALRNYRSTLLTPPMILITHFLRRQGLITEDTPGLLPEIGSVRFDIFLSSDDLIMGTLCARHIRFCASESAAALAVDGGFLLELVLNPSFEAGKEVFGRYGAWRIRNEICFTEPAMWTMLIGTQTKPTLPLATWTTMLLPNNCFDDLLHTEMFTRNFEPDLTLPLVVLAPSEQEVAHRSFRSALLRKDLTIAGMDLIDGNEQLRKELTEENDEVGGGGGGGSASRRGSDVGNLSATMEKDYPEPTDEEIAAFTQHAFQTAGFSLEEAMRAVRGFSDVILQTPSYLAGHFVKHSKQVQKWQAYEADKAMKSGLLPVSGIFDRTTVDIRRDKSGVVACVTASDLILRAGLGQRCIEGTVILWFFLNASVSMSKLHHGSYGAWKLYHEIAFPSSSELHGIIASATSTIINKSKKELEEEEERERDLF